MTKKYLIDGLKKVMKPYLDEHGISIKQNGCIVNSGTDIRWQIIIGFCNYGTIEIDGLTTHLRFNHLEKAIVDIIYYGEVDIFNNRPYPLKVMKERYEYTSTINGPVFKKNSVRFFQDEQISLLSEFLIEFIEQQLEPFCKKYPDIYSVNQKFHEFDPPYQEGVGYVGLYEEYPGISPKYADYTAHTFVRKLLLLKFTKDPRFDDYIEWIKECRDTGQLFSSLHKLIDKVIAYPIPKFYLK